MKKKILNTVILTFLILNLLACSRKKEDTLAHIDAKEINSFSYTLPDDLVYEAGEKEIKLYWIYNNVLLERNGYDIKPYLGKEIKISILQNKKNKEQMFEPRIIAMTYENELIGKFIDKGRHNCFENIIDIKNNNETDNVKKWEETLKEHYNFDSKLDKEIENLSAKEVLEYYFKAWEDGSFEKMRACLIMNPLQIESAISSNLENHEFVRETFEERKLKNYEIVGEEHASHLDGEVAIRCNFETDEWDTSMAFSLKRQFGNGPWKIVEIGNG